MNGRSRRRFALRVLLAMAALAVSGSARADSKKACAESYVNAQKLRRDGALKRAREELLVCSREECIPAVKKDCVDWLGEVSGAIPSVVIVARDPSGKETLDVRVSVDGKLAAERASVSGVELDPGTHTLKLEIAGADPIERQVIVRQGEKNKVVEVSFGSDAARAPTAQPAPAPMPPAAAEPARERPILAYALGGVGVVALGVAGAFWIGAESGRGDLDEARCAPRCNPDDVSAIERDRLIGDVALGVGLVSLGIATYLLLRPSSSRPSLSRSPALPVNPPKLLKGRSGAWEIRF